MDWLDYVRLPCALWVMAEHYLVISVEGGVVRGLTGPGAAGDLLRFGTMALCAFLMMSGLVVMLMAQRRSTADFVASRFARVYPTFILCMTVTALVAPYAPPRFAMSWGQYAANWAIYAPAFGQRYVDGVYWTLVVEMNFYLLVAALLLTGAIRRLEWAVAVWLAAQVVAALRGVNLPLIGPDYCFIAAGAAMSLHYQRRAPAFVWPLLLLAFMLCLYSAAYYADSFGFGRPGAWAGTALIFATFLVMRGRGGKLPFAHRIGSMTYPLYLLHFVIGNAILFHFADAGNFWWVAGLTMAGMVVAGFVIDDLIYFRSRALWIRVGEASIARPFALAEQWLGQVVSRSRGALRG